MRRPLISAMARRRESGAGMLAQPGSVMPSASARLVMVEAVPITVQCPALRAMHAFDFAPLFLAKPAGAEEVEELAAIGARAEPPVAPLACEHRPAGNHDRRHVRAGRPHQLRGRGLIAAAQQHHAVQRIGPDGSPPRPSPSGCGTAWWWAA